MNAFFIVARSTSAPSIGRRRRPLISLSQYYRRRRCRVVGFAPPSSREDEGKADASTDAATSRATHDAIAVEGTADEKLSTGLAGAKFVPPRPIFPWRSLPDPLPRLLRPTRPPAVGDDDDESVGGYYDSEYFARGGPLGPGWPSPMEPWFRGALYLTSMNLLGLSWPSIILPWTRGDWERDAGWAFCNAFSNGVNGMIEDVYRVLPSSSDDDGGGGDDEKTGLEKKSEGDPSGADDGEAYDVDVDVSLDPLPLDDGRDDPGEVSEDGAREDEYNMLQRDLRRLYESARRHSHPSGVNIVLRTVPQSATIESMFPVFGLSRSLVEDHPYLRHTYRNYLKRLQAKHKEAVLAGKSRLNPVQVGTFVMDGLQEVMEASARLSGDGKAAITIVAQVSIHCKEVFCVRDVESGAIIQGHGDARPRDVTHLVRFEMVVRETLANVDDSVDSSREGDWELEIGRWQITDWDDIMDGNVFFT